jgi:phospholipid/cholesterol/gamma-HCH transport system permease protein
MQAGHFGVFTPWLRLRWMRSLATILPPLPKPPSASWQANGRLDLSGEWVRGSAPVAMTGVAPGEVPSSYVTTDLGTFDSTLPAFVFAHLRSAGGSKEQTPSLDGLPDNLRGLLELALAVPEETPHKDDASESSFLGRVGLLTTRVYGSAIELLEFIGLTTLSLIRFVTFRAHFRSIDFWIILQECGYKALPIVTLISFLIGLILAFVGNVQLTNFGANLYVADLVGIAMVREMGVVMTAIIMSGRTGAAFAAHIGSMKANEEIDALRTFGFDPFDFLVLPRLIALVLMMPLLTIYSNVVGILGGMLVGAFVGIPPILYWNETLTSVDITNSSLGVFKSVFFGAAIAISGCMQGMKAGNSSAAVGEATTKAVVTAITSIVVLDSAFAAIFTLLDL